MPSIRYVPWLQPVYDLWRADAGTDADAARAVDDWSRRTGLTLPASVREFYTAVVRIPQYDEERDALAEEPWVLPLTGLWQEYNPAEGRLRSLEEVLAAAERARVGGDPLAELGLRWPASAVPAECGPLVSFECEVHRTLMCCFDAGTPGDPAVWTYSDGGRVPWGDGWGRESATFSGWLLDWFASFYHEQDLPLSIFGPDVEVEPTRYPVMPYRNGLWAYAVDWPISQSVTEELTQRYGEGERRAVGEGGGAIRFCWDLPDGVVSVTTDCPDDGDHDEDCVASWFVHGDSPQRLGELLDSVMDYGGLDRTLVNSRYCVGHAEADRVLKDVCGRNRIPVAPPGPTSP